MQEFGAMLLKVIELLKIPITVYGLTFSMWDIALFMVLAAIVLGFVGRLMN